mmetsp:Transcript_2812/g.4020  ORF Transcript_2812/g.4020 Transcript_2812/m.4020 type:complete len:404 (-) Transcript_2812:62-1273(-)|eukprot:CAMPEP_0202447596 /NCGR_PEP_ID=MMETSP1360-20130828/6364_1 /ASSEMBLY_ACC=CAM_ASM_000848 /TAXON_ID=515479 /ORGANISM="Licmophora paradoxa, Strain CCMP2313" /LENGTH=403 /DNA_ID=CAMNT_0049064767 /DNA_START=67 /DNA_END=1278 /DNA_ORIENTATION=+
MAKKDSSDHDCIPFEQVESSGDAARPLDFPPPLVARGVRVNALVVHPQSGSRQVCSGVIHREDLSGKAYWPQRRLQDAIYGSVWACLVLKRHVGQAADDAAKAAGVQPGSPQAPIVWEIEQNHVAIKMVEWARVHHMRGRLLEDPVKEVSALQLLGHRPNPHVLGSMEVLQDNDFLYSVMPFCKGGDLFGIVVRHAEESGGDVGMPEPVARYWFRQILQGLYHLQSLGVCHRDLSLENILVDEHDCMVIDLGMCLRIPYTSREDPSRISDVTGGIIRRLMRPQGVCGKHNYMSPEIFKNTEPFDGFAVDLWAAGVILYIMLTGFPPYDQASTTDQRFDLIVNGRLMEQLQNWDIVLSAEAGHLMQSMLQLDPRKRLTLRQVMTHPWVVDGHVQPPPKERRHPF